MLALFNIRRLWQATLTLQFFFPHTTSGEGETLVFIDHVHGYSQLSACAEQPLSTIVRGVRKGCDDEARLTSYTCFCTESFSKISFDISTDVLSQCSNRTAPAKNAVKVFTDYCSVGVRSGLPLFTDHYSSPLTTTTTGNATPQATAALTSTTKATPTNVASKGYYNMDGPIQGVIYITFGTLVLVT